MRKKVLVNDKMQKNYCYELSEPVGENFDRYFCPELTPKEMLAMGIFCGRYMRDCRDEFPKDWFEKAKFAREKKDCKLNFFRVNASMPLSYWEKKGWIFSEDPRGWFQWYCRYYFGRRIPQEDRRQIQRWRAMKRHVAQIKRNCVFGDWQCRKKQRQALLQVGV
mgnify:CR=1 FL=1